MDNKIVFDFFLNWDDNFLTPLQKDSIKDLMCVAQDRPLPQELPLDDIFIESLSIAKNKNHEFNSERNIIETSDQFLLNYCKLEDEIIKDNSTVFKAYAEELIHRQNDALTVINDVNASLKALDSLEEKYAFVSNKTNSLHDACLAALEEEAKLVNSAESISQKLRYFSELDILSQKLVSHTSVVSESFVPLLSRLDECIAYLQANKHFKEAEIYLIRFKHLQNIALGLIKSYVVATLEQIAGEVSPKEENSISPENAFTLYYAKFRSHGPKIRALVKQIEDRAENNAEYNNLLSDCYQCYFYHRTMLLGPSVQAAINELSVNVKNDHSTLVRKACAFMEHICQDESELFDQFFARKSVDLENYLESLCIRLYDILRPIIIHINHLETLAEMCGILKMEMLDKGEENARELRSFDAIISQMLQDIQERLVYRTHVYLKTDILNYKPSPGDLAYPEKLVMMESIAESLSSENLKRSLSQLSIASTTSLNSVFSHRESDEELNSALPESKSSFSNQAQDNLPNNVESSFGSLSEKNQNRKSVSYSAADLHAFWYPTVRRSLLCLSKLYRCLDNTIFQGLAEEVLSTCIQSLTIAGENIAKRKTLTDGHLFQIKHLLILREQIAPFQIDFAIKETTLNFNTIKDAAYSLLQKRSKLLSISSNNALLEFLLQGAPHVTEHLIDSKKKIDKQLKFVCEEFIDHISSTVLNDILQFLEKAKVMNEIQASSTEKKINLSSQPFASVEIVNQMICDVIRALKNKLPAIQRSMSLYLANPDTEYVLYRPIKARIQTAFENLLQLIRVNYTEEEQIIIACPTGEEICVMLASSVVK